MNWFKRHLNWTIGIGLLAYFVLGLIFLYSGGLLAGSLLLDRILVLLWIPLAFLLILAPSGELGDKVPNLSDVLILFSVLIPVVWASRQKRRSWGWLLLPLGWIAPLILKSKQKAIGSKGN